MRRQWAAAEARGLGYGGVTTVSCATGLSRTTIAAGLAELDLPLTERFREAMRVRRPGGGRRPLTESDPQLLEALESLIEPSTRGNPESPLRWTCKSTRRLARELTRMGHPVGRETVASLLHEADYSLQSDRKTREGSSHPDRDAQFCYINRLVRHTCAGNSRRSRSTRKRRNWWGISRTAAVNGIPWASRRRSVCMTSRTRPLARSSLMASTTSSITRAGSASGSITTRRSSPPTASAAGGHAWDAIASGGSASC